MFSALIVTLAILVAPFAYADAITSQDTTELQRARPEVTDNTQTSVVNIGSIISGDARRGPKGERGPVGPIGAQGPPATIQVVSACASCADSNGQRTNYTSLGPMAAALIAGLFGLLGLVISKENKTSEFRQAWIDALRNDIADYSASARAFTFYESARQAETDRTHELEYEKILKDVYDRLSHAQMRIRLRINPQDSKPAMRVMNDKLLATIEDIRTDLNAPDFDAAKIKLTNLHESAAPVLKAEWDRVKRGEPPYIFSKWLAMGLVLAGFLAMVYVLAKSAA
jgi:hypothetical protein